MDPNIEQGFPDSNPDVSGFDIRKITLSINNRWRWATSATAWW